MLSSQKNKTFKYYSYSYSDMTTTIQVSNATKQMLESLKEKRMTYDEVIQGLAKSKKQIPASLFGKMKGGQWKNKDRLEFHER